MKTLTSALVLGLASARLLAGDAAGDTPSPWKAKFQAKPSLLHGTASDVTAAALRYDTSLRYHYDPWTSKLTGFAEALSQGTVATDARANTENLFAEIRGGLVYDFYEPPTPAAPPPPGERSPLDVPSTPTGGYDFGRISLAPNVRFETDQPFENYQLTYGGVLGYGNLKQTGWWALAPSVQAEFQRVEVLYSRYYHQLGVEEDAFYRLGLIASWDWAIGEDLAPNSRFWRPFGLHFDVRFYQSYDLPSGAGIPELRESLYFAGGINYELTGRLKWIRSVYVTVAHGRLPPATEDETMVYFGVVLGTKGLATRD